MKSNFFKKMSPFVAFLCFGGIAVVLWLMQNGHERELLLRHTETTAEQVRTRFEGLMNSRISSLEFLADRWIERDPPDFSYRRFAGFADNLLKHYPGFVGVHWIDPEGVIQWVFPEGGNAVVKGTSLHEHPDERCREAFRMAAQWRERFISPCIQLQQGGMGLEVVFPLVYKGELQGYLEGVFQVEQVMELSLARGILESFTVSVYEGDQRVYQAGPGKGGAEAIRDFSVAREMRFGERVWQLVLEPNVAVSAWSFGGNLPLLLFGLTLSGSLALLLHLLIRRMDIYRASRDLALHEVGERTRIEAVLRENEKKLEAALGELGARNAELESFVYTVSHDLKTPIVTIDGFIGALREDFGKCITEDGERYLNYMSSAAQKMESLINDLLNLSRIGRVLEKKTAFPFAEAVEGALEMLKPQIESSGITLQVQEGLPEVYGERKRIGQLMDNLLSNAVKYIGRDNPAPRIEIGLESVDGQGVLFVRDNGIGIEERYFDKIFQIFQRLPAAKQAGEGTGMGLTIVKRIIEHHGGRIWLTSEPGKGTTFYFTLGKKDA